MIKGPEDKDLVPMTRLHDGIQSTDYTDFYSYALTKTRLLHACVAGGSCAVVDS
jgi:hypothetical protein